MGLNHQKIGLSGHMIFSRGKPHSGQCKRKRDDKPMALGGIQFAFFFWDAVDVDPGLMFTLKGKPFLVATDDCRSLGVIR
jgi:hypothetical protein